MKAERFSSRLGLLLAALGMAVGTGNIWRFPRVLAQSGGGAFLVPWLVALFAWSIPLLVLELGMGRLARRGCVGAFARLAGPRAAVLGGFVALASTAILFYYAVVAGWCLKYLGLAALGELGGLAGEAAERRFLAFANSPEPVLYQAASLALAAWVVRRGVVGGIERANRLLIPTLFALLLLAAGRALTLPGSAEGLRFLFHVEPARLLDVDTWLQGLTQSAWSTGAGWGLLLTYGVYVSREERVLSSALLTGLGNNAASLVAALAVIPAVFALAPAALGPERLAELGGVEGLLASSGPASTGLTFLWLPALFARMPGGRAFTALFFLALFFAALSSLIAMVEMAARVLSDLGLPRSRAVPAVALLAWFLGIPSAVNLEFFQNQDWVWGVGLLVSGLFVSLAVSLHGPARFRREALAPDEARLLGRAFDLWVRLGIPALFLGVLGWWFAQSVSWDPEHWWDPLGTFTVGTCLLQWGLGLLGLLLLQPLLARSAGEAQEAGEA